MASEAGNGTDSNAGNGHHSTTFTEMTDLATKLFNSIATANGTQANLIISPLLLEATLALLYLGSDGTTAEELQRVLQLNKRYANNAKMANYYAAQLAAATKTIGGGLGSGSVGGAEAAAPVKTTATTSSTHIAMCSKLLVPENYEISDEFRKIAQKYFQTEATTVTTAGKLQDDTNLIQICGKEYAAELLQTALNLPSTSAISFVAANFRNKWFLPFSAYRTGLYDFHAYGADATQEDSQQQQLPKPVAMLFDDDMFVKFGEFRELDARAIELPYEWDDEDDELSMLLVLPNKRDGLAELMAKLCQTDLTSLVERMQMESVQVLLPKFQIDFECSLRQSLEQLGVSAIFGKDANFKNLLHEKSSHALQLEQIVQRVHIQVNESGSDVSTVAAALKPIVISNSLNGRQKFFRADHPFYFAVRNCDAIYFMGQVTSF